MLQIPLGFALSFLLLNLACQSHYGFFRDELYFAACGQRPDWGYVDQPPLIAFIARFAWWLSGSGSSVALFRVPSYLAGSACILVSALLARRLGGGRYAMALAACASFGSPLLLAQSHLMSMNIFEILLWETVALLTAIAVAGSGPAWLAAGALLGLALSNKYSAGLLTVGLLLGLLVTPERRFFRSRWLWAGVALTVLLGLPSLLWQARHAYPFLELLRNGRLYKNTTISPARQLCEALAEQGPLGAILVICGCYQLLISRESLEARFLGLSSLFVVMAFLIHGAKPYYLGPAFPPLFIAGAVLVERRLSSRALRRALLVAPPWLTFVMAPLATPLFPNPLRALAYMEALNVHPIRLERRATQEMPQHFADQLGWPERVQAVARVVDGFSPEERKSMVIFTTNYGRAAALEMLGEGLHLPPVVCSHNQYYLWGSAREPEIVLALGGNLTLYQQLYGQVTSCGSTPSCPEGMPYESEIPIYCCRKPRAPIAQLLALARHYD